MKTIVLPLIFCLSVLADDVKVAPLGSGTGAFVSSPASARGVAYAGIKTAHACIPLKGFGNTLSTNGIISTDTNLDWVWTERVISVEWTTNLNAYHGEPIKDLQDEYIAGSGGLLTDGIDWSKTLWDGYTNLPIIGYVIDGTWGYYEEYDRTSETNFNALPSPAVVSYSTNTIQTADYYQYFIASGSSLSIASSTTGTLNDPSFVGWTTSTNLTNVAGSVVTYSKSGSSTNVISVYSYPAFTPHTGGAGNFNFAEASFSYTKTVRYTNAVSLADVGELAETNLSNVNLQNKWERYYYFDQTNCPVLIRWNNLDRTNGTFLEHSLYRAEVAAGVTNSFSSRIFYVLMYQPFQFTNQFFIDPAPVVGKSYIYKIGVTYTAPTVFYYATSAVVSVTIPTNPVLGELESYPYSTLPTYATNINPVATPLWYQLKYTIMSGATNLNQTLCVFPTSNSFVLSSNVSCGTPTPVFLAGLVEPFGSGLVSIGVSGATGYVSSKSIGYLTGNSPSNTPPGTNYLEKIYFTNSPLNRTTNSFEITTNFSPITFPRGRLGGWPWQLSPQLLFKPSDCPSNGIIYYR